MAPAQLAALWLAAVWRDYAKMPAELPPQHFLGALAGKKIFALNRKIQVGRRTSGRAGGRPALSKRRLYL